MSETDDTYVILDPVTMVMEERERIEKIIKTIFQWIALFKYEEARNAITQAFDTTARLYGTGNEILLPQLKKCLNELVDVEREYTQLEKKVKTFNLMRIKDIKDFKQNLTKNIILNVDRLRQTLQSMSDTSALQTGESSNSSISSDSNSILAIISPQLDLYTRARFIMLHEEVIMKHSDSNGRLDYYMEGLKKVEEVKSMIPQLNSDLMEPLIGLLEYETFSVQNLFSCYIALSQFEFAESLLYLQLFSKHYREFIRKFSEKELSLRKPAKGDEFPELYKWFCRLYELLLSKYTLYFSRVIIREGGKISRGNSTDYCSRITEFQRKTKANSITLLLNKKKLNKPFLGDGYKIRFGDLDADSKEFEVPINQNYFRDQLEVIFFLGKDDKLGDVESSEIANLYVETINGRGKPYFYNHNTKKTYFVSLVDENIFLGLVYHSEKKERDTDIQKFIEEMNSNLKLTKVF